MDRIRYLAPKKTEVIFTKSSCCMCHIFSNFLLAIHELDKGPSGREKEKALQKLSCSPSVPAVFIGRRYVGSPKDIISLYFDWSLMQMLMDARPFWL